MLDRIQQLFKTQQRLIADVSHELRTPLTTVQGNIELLRTAPQPAGAHTPTSHRLWCRNRSTKWKAKPCAWAP